MYKPNYDTEIRTVTVATRQDTLHVDRIDWENYPFNDPDITSAMCCSDEYKAQHVEKLKEYLRLCEQFSEKEVYASNYGGWPRIWHKVLGVGMASKWPYWKPRPVVIVDGPLGGVEWYDWASLTGVKLAENSD